MPTTGRRPLRRDAVENAERVLAAAVRSGLNHGTQVAMADIAAEAGVGVGTLYRRYHSREGLLRALQARAYRMLIEMAEHAHDTTASGHDAIDAFLRGSFEIRDQLVLPLHGAPWLGDEESAVLRGEMRSTLMRLVQRGHADGTVREDVSARTVVQFGAMLAQPLTALSAEEAGATAQRAVFLRGIRPD